MYSSLELETAQTSTTTNDTEKEQLKKTIEQEKMKTKQVGDNVLEALHQEIYLS